MHIQLGEVHRCSIGVQRRKIRRSGAAETETGRRGGSMRERGWDRGGLILNPGDWRGLDETRGDEKPRNTRWYWRAEWRQIKTHSSDATIRHPIQLRCRCFGSIPRVQLFFSPTFYLYKYCTSPYLSFALPLSTASEWRLPLRIRDSEKHHDAG